MLPRWLVGPALLASGCNLVFGLDPATPGDDAVDARGDGDPSPDATLPWGPVTPIPIAATPSLEDDPQISPDGMELYFARQADPGSAEVLVRSYWDGNAWIVAN